MAQARSGKRAPLQPAAAEAVLGKPEPLPHHAGGQIRITHRGGGKTSLRAGSFVSLEHRDNNDPLGDLAGAMRDQNQSLVG